MPLIRIEMFEGRSREQKKELVQAVTRETARVLNCGEDAVDIILAEVKREDWATAGTFWSER
jgi:4-oxalocrotonate tautomerase